MIFYTNVRASREFFSNPGSLVPVLVVISE
jgi:hypothetical protein